MKLVVMIPCFNEEKTLPDVLRGIPKRIKGIDKIEIVIIDDGSTDKTADVAGKYGVKHIVYHHVNRGLSASFADGLDKALRIGADIIVNTDGDNQYPQEDIPLLIKPILENKADVVIGDRQTHKIKHFSLGKKLLQKCGSYAVSAFAGIKVPDAVSGFRAFSRDAAMHLNIFTEYTYTIETIIQAGKKKMRIESIRIKTKPKNRESRLIKNLWVYIKSSGATILRLFAIYEPLKTFSLIGITIAVPGIVLIGRFTYLYFVADIGAHLQSLIIGSFLILIGFQTILIGLMADLTAINRKKLEHILYRQKKIDLDRK